MEKQDISSRVVRALHKLIISKDNDHHVTTVEFGYRDSNEFFRVKCLKTCEEGV